MKNYRTETDLKAYFPELDDYLHSGQTNFDNFKSGATIKVATDIKNKGYDLRKLQTPLVLIDEALTSNGTGDNFEDKANRLRLVYNVTVRTGTTSFILQGCNEDSEDDDDWNDIQTITLTATGESSVIFTEAYKYYRISYSVSGTLTIKISLVETNYDILFIYKELELIMMNNSKQSGDKWWDKMLYFRETYNDNLGAMVISIDEDDDGEISEKELSSTNLTTMYK